MTYKKNISRIKMTISDEYVALYHQSFKMAKNVFFFFFFFFFFFLQKWADTFEGILPLRQKNQLKLGG